MTFEDPPLGEVAGFRVFMSKDFRLVICPSGEMLALTSIELDRVPDDLRTWNLPVSSFVIDL